MDRILITGADGFIGRHLTSLLLEDKNNRVTGISRNNKSTQNPRMQWVKCDLTNENQVLGLLKGGMFDTCFHFAWDGSNGVLRGNYNTQLQNVIMTVRLAELLEQSGCRRMIIAGTISEKAALHNAERGIKASRLLYGICKDNAHKILNIISNSNNWKIKIAWCVMPGVYGIHDDTSNIINYAIESFLENKHPAFGPGEQWFNTVEVNDCVRALVMIGKKMVQSREFYLGTESPQRLKQYIIKIRDIINPQSETGLAKNKDDGIEYLPEWFTVDLQLKEWGYQADRKFEENIRLICSRRKLDKNVGLGGKHNEHYFL